jgi:DNA-binding phage protein
MDSFECNVCPKKRLEITKEKLLLVEGNDDKLFIDKFLKKLFRDDIQTHPIIGKGNFDIAHLKAITSMASFKNVKSLGLVRDADDDAENTFRSLCGILEAVGLSFPDKPNKFTNDSIRTGIFIISPNAKKGNIEDLCLAAIKDLKEMDCIEDLFKCLKTKLSNDEFPQNISKSKIQAFLSSRKISVPHLGIATQKDYFPLDNNVFDGIKDFLLQI